MTQYKFVTKFKLVVMVTCLLFAGFKLVVTVTCLLLAGLELVVMGI